MSKLVCSGTFSKAPSAWGFPDDLYAMGCSILTNKVLLSDGRSYIDWVSGLGAIILGNDMRFNDHVRKQLFGGIAYSITNRLEHEVADLLVEKVGSEIWDDTSDIRIRFAKTGSEACAMAVRLARWYTGRNVIASFGYHGWFSEFIAAEYPAHGIPVAYQRDLLRKIKWNDKTSVDDAFRRGQVGALMVEHPPDGTDDGWYSYLRAMSEVNGATFIMDEVVTGLRFGIGGISAKHNVKPDLVCMGKALGNGLPISAVMGRKDIMDGLSRNDPVFCSSTHWGETVSLSATKYILEMWNRDRVNYLVYIGDALLQGLKNAGWDCYGHPQRSLLRFEDDYERAFFIHGMRHRGHLFNRPNFPTLAHTIDDVRDAVTCAEDLREEYENIDKEKLRESLKSHLPRVLFRNR
jgi:glutamate-1-semialdehyde aminotransferase